jgi:hypothetical protein
MRKGKSQSPVRNMFRAKNNPGMERPEQKEEAS